MVGIEVRKPSLRMGEGCAAGKRPARRKRERLSLRALESRVPGQGIILEPGAAKSEAREQGKRSRHGRVGFYLQAMKPGFSCIDDPGVVQRDRKRTRLNSSHYC